MTLIANPTEFIDVVADRPAAFRDWVANVGGASLRNYGECSIDRRCLHEGMIQATRDARPTTSKAIDARDVLAKKLEETPVTDVD